MVVELGAADAADGQQVSSALPNHDGHVADGQRTKLRRRRGHRDLRRPSIGRGPRSIQVGWGRLLVSWRNPAKSPSEEELRRDGSTVLEHARVDPQEHLRHLVFGAKPRHAHELPRHSPRGHAGRPPRLSARSGPRCALEAKSAKLGARRARQGSESGEGEQAHRLLALAERFSRHTRLFGKPPWDRPIVRAAHAERSHLGRARDLGDVGVTERSDER